MLVGQFTYTACQSPGPYSAIPGWKVKQAERAQPDRELPAAAVQAAVRPFGVFAAPAVPPLATKVEIEQLPRCLRLDVLEGPYRSVAHLAAAGRDHSGRDAFFAHGLMVVLTWQEVPLLVRGGPAKWGVLRPADLWAADGWLTPYRADAIEVALVGEPPIPSAASPLNPERREDFVDLHPGQREFVLAAAERAMTVGTPLVIVGLPVEAAMWTSLVSHLLVPSVGWTLTFSTYEAGAHPDTARGVTGLPAILGVPNEDAAAWRRVPADQVVVHDPTSAQPREPAGYRLFDGSLLSVGPWAELAERICAAGLENDVRFAVDDWGAGVGAGFDRWPLLGLAAAVLTMPTTVLELNPAIAQLAARIVVEHFPSGHQSDPAVLGSLVDAVFRWSPDALGTSEQLLVALDRGPETSGVVVDRLLDGYLRALLGSPSAIAEKSNPWIPQRLRLSAPAADRLLADLDGLIGWVDQVEHPIPNARLILTVAALAEQLGWLNPPARTVVERVVGDRARASVVPLILGDRVRLGAQAWPRIPGWLWHDVIVDALQGQLVDYPAGSVLADPQLRRVVDDAAGPLPSAYVAGETLGRVTLVDGERAAALLLAGGESPTHTITAAQDEVLRAAAFLRSVGTAGGRIQVRPDQLFDELRRWFPEPAPRAVVLRDLLDQLRGMVPISDLCAFAVAALDCLPPDGTTATIANELNRAAAAANDLLNTAAEWHHQFDEQQPVTSRQVSMRMMPLTRPDGPETRLLDYIAAGRLRPALAEAGRRRLARWVLVLAAESLDLPGNAVAMEQTQWLALAFARPLHDQLRPLYPQAAKALIAEIDQTRRRPPLAADVLAAEWVVRARMADMGVGPDPARSFFRDFNGRQGDWAGGVRALMRPSARPKDQLAAWVDRVRRSAELAALAARLPRAPEDRRQSFIESAAESAERLVSLPGLIGRIRRTPAARQDPG